MAFPKTMLFTPTPPGEGSVGENYLRQVVKVFPADSICCFAAWSPNYAIYVPAPELDWLDMEYVQLPQEQLAGKLPGPVLDKLERSSQRRKHWSALEKIVDQAVSFGKARHVEVVFAVLASPSTIMMARAVARRLNARLVALVWDPPQSTMKLLGFEPAAVEAVLGEFEQVLRACQKCVVASEGMREDYFLQFGIDSKVLTRPIDPALRQPFKEVTSADRFVIGFAGSIYAAEEMKALIATIGQMGWEIDGRQICLRIMGNHFGLPVYAAGKRAHVEFLGHRPLEEAIALLSTVDLAYLPYWFDKRFALSVRTCFPDKLVSYLTAGVPIFYHGPEDSSPTRFLERYPAGIGCHSLDTSAIEAKLRAAAADPTFRKTAYAAQQRAYQEELNPQVFCERLMELVGAGVEARGPQPALSS